MAVLDAAQTLTVSIAASGWAAKGKARSRPGSALFWVGFVVVDGGVARFELGGWVGVGVDFLELLDGYVRIDLGGGEAGVAEHGLDVADVGSAFEHQGGHGVAKEVTGASLAELGSEDVIPHHLAQMVSA